MSQEYTPVQWVDETATEPGTVINKARLDQMQTAHHYADGFEEVDAVPSADPGVSYHKVVYCTADSTFYRWDGTQWTKDIDDDTKALLLAHEADHANPHQVTKTQVGLGNVDNKASVSSWQGTPDNDHIPTEKLVKDSLDGKVTIVPVSSGIKFYGQGSGGPAMYQGTSGATTGITSIPLRDSSGRIKTAGPSANEDAANKKYVDDLDALAMHLTQTGNVNLTGDLTITGNITQNGSSYETHAEKVYTTNDYIITRDGATGALASGDYSGFQVKKYDGTNDGRLVIDNTGTARVGDVGDEQPLLTRDEAASMTDGAILKWDGTNYKAVTESANIGSDTKPIKIVGGVATAVANDLVDTASNQTIDGSKTFSNAITGNLSGTATNATYLGSNTSNVGTDSKPVKIVNGQAVEVGKQLGIKNTLFFKNTTAKACPYGVYTDLVTHNITETGNYLINAFVQVNEVGSHGSNTYAIGLKINSNIYELFTGSYWSASYARSTFTTVSTLYAGDTISLVGTPSSGTVNMEGNCSLVRLE